jgi:hypothetical protein
VCINRCVFSCRDFASFWILKGDSNGTDFCISKQNKSYIISNGTLRITFYSENSEHENFFAQILAAPTYIVQLSECHRRFWTPGSEWTFLQDEFPGLETLFQIQLTAFWYKLVEKSTCCQWKFVSDWVHSASQNFISSVLSRHLTWPCNKQWSD